MAKSAKCPGGEAHKYQRFKIGKNQDYPVYRCMNAGCAHYISADLLAGRTALCWMCDSVFQIQGGRQLWKPLCQNCRKDRNEKYIPLTTKEAMSQKNESNFEEEDMTGAASSVLDNLLDDILSKSGK